MTASATKIASWLISTVAIYLVYQNTRALIANDIARAFASMLLVAALNILAVVIYAGVIGYRNGHQD
jgi:hypothetical protein